MTAALPPAPAASAAKPTVLQAAELLATHGIDASARHAIQSEAEALAARLRLPLRTAIGGIAGQSFGRGAGVSLEFQDHRHYQPGDDPRHLNWAAFARTNQYIMKMFREEVSPRLDLVLDCSPSMFLTAAKSRRTLELFAFAAASATQSGAIVRAWLVTPTTASLIPAEALRANAWPFLPYGGAPEVPALTRVQWGVQAVRVIITDLLFPAQPETVLRAVTHLPGRVIIFSPWSAAEASPDWDGQVELRDCESGVRQLLQATPARLERYRDNYRRHFALWEEACRGSGVALARMSEAGQLSSCLLESAFPSGAVELAHA